MPQTLLQIVRAVQAELGLPQASIVIGSTDASTVQMLALANRCVDELRRSNPTGWGACQFEYDLVVPPPIKVTGDLGTANTNTITNIVPNTTGVLANYFSVSGSNIPQAARVTAVPNSATVTMSMEATNVAPVLGTTFSLAQDTFPMPADFDWFQNETMWDRTNQWQLVGPDSPQQDQWQRSSVVADGPRRHFRKSGPYANSFRIWPAPQGLTVPLQLVFEYLSLNAVNTHGGGTTFSQFFANDDDQPLLDDQAIITGIKWMFWEAKGMGSYVTLQNRWVDYVDRLIARDGGAQTLSFVKRSSSTLITSDNIQDGNFPGS